MVFTSVYHCGGLLILNSVGRPTEFHCTAPVPENRAQRILYGPTYESFLYCDQIGLALVGKARRRPDVLITNNENMLHLNDLVEAPVMWIESHDILNDVNGSKSDPFRSFDMHDYRVWTPIHEGSDFDKIRQLCISLTESIPIDEPFERITQAIEEAQAVVR